MAKTGYSRRRVMATAAAASATFSMPFVRGAYAAGKLSVGFWDHWVPGANDTAEQALPQQWADKEKVDLTIDFITSHRRQAAMTDGGRGAGRIRA